VVGRPNATFYRIAKGFPPSSSEYRTKRQKDGDPPPNATVAIVRAYDGLSAFDTEEGARQQAKQCSGRLSYVFTFRLEWELRGNKRFVRGITLSSVNWKRSSVIWIPNSSLLSTDFGARKRAYDDIRTLGHERGDIAGT
jgi:hypothetical protein